MNWSYRVRYGNCLASQAWSNRNEVSWAFHSVERILQHFTSQGQAGLLCNGSQKTGSIARTLLSSWISELAVKYESHTCSCASKVLCTMDLCGVERVWIAVYAGRRVCQRISGNGRSVVESSLPTVLSNQRKCSILVAVRLFSKATMGKSCKCHISIHRDNNALTSQ